MRPAGKTGRSGVNIETVSAVYHVPPASPATAYVNGNGYPARLQGARGPLGALVLQGLVAGLALLLLMAFVNGELAAAAAVRYLPGVIVLLFAWIVASWYWAAGSVFNPYGIFVLAAILFNGANVVLYTFRLNDHLFLNATIDAYATAATLLAVLLAFTFFHLGGLVALGLRGSRDPAQTGRAEPGVHPRALRQAGWLMLAISVVPVILVFSERMQVVLAQGYSAIYAQESATGWSGYHKILAEFFVPGCLFLLAGSRRHTRWVVLTAVLIALYSAAIFFQGYRGHATMPLVAYLWVRHRTVKRVRATTLLVGALVLLLVVFPVIASSRNIAGAERLSLVALADVYFSIENPAVATLREMGSSWRTIAHTVELVPQVRPFDLGRGYLYSWFSVVPNFWGDLHPAVTHARYSAWLTEIVNPYLAARGGSIGFSFIAEAYLNFGWLGLTGWMALLGAFFAGLTTWSESLNRPLRVAFVGSFLASCLYYARGEFLFIPRPLVWYALLPMLLAILLHRYAHRVNRRGG